MSVGDGFAEYGFSDEGAYSGKSEPQVSLMLTQPYPSTYGLRCYTLDSQTLIKGRSKS